MLSFSSFVLYTTETVYTFFDDDDDDLSPAVYNPSKAQIFISNLSIKRF